MSPEITHRTLKACQVIFLMRRYSPRIPKGCENPVMQDEKLRTNVQVVVASEDVSFELQKDTGTQRRTREDEALDKVYVSPHYRLRSIRGLT